MNRYGLKQEVKRWCQRRIWGWDDSDTWDLAQSMAVIMLPRFKKLRKFQREHHEEDTQYKLDMDNIEYFLYKLSQGYDGNDYRFIPAGEDHPEYGELTEMKLFRDKRYFRGAKALIRNYRRLWW